MITKKEVELIKKEAKYFVGGKFWGKDKDL